MNRFIPSVLLDKGRRVFTIDGSASVRSAVRETNEAGIGSLLVMEDGWGPVGIITERDVVRRVIDANRACGRTRVSDVITALGMAAPSGPHRLGEGCPGSRVGGRRADRSRSRSLSTFASRGCSTSSRQQKLVGESSRTASLSLPTTRSRRSGRCLSRRS